MSLTVWAAPAAALSLPADPDPPRVLVVDPGLLARLQVLAAGLHNEIVLCLIGSTDGQTAVARGFVMPDPHVSDTDRASFGPCPDTAVAIWHNHPLEGRPPLPVAGAADPSYARPRGDPNASPRDLCALSETDIRTAAHERYPFVVIAVNAGTWCWWTRDQVLAFARRKAMRGDPVPGQVESRSYQAP